MVKKERCMDVWREGGKGVENKGEQDQYFCLCCSQLLHRIEELFEHFVQLYYRQKACTYLVLLMDSTETGFDTNSSTLLVTKNYVQ